jgi:hypothetical protein
MIDDLDEVLRQFLIRDLPIRNGEVDIKFDQPKREWSARVSRPTLNLFLYDIRENQKLRQAQPTWEMVRNDDGTVTKYRKPARVDLHYMVTAWATEPEDEHRLLSRTLMVLFRYPHLPEELLPESFGMQPVPIPMMVAQYDEFRNATDVWNVLDNEMRPALAWIITLAVDPYLPITAPLVRTRELIIGQSGRPVLRTLDDARGSADTFWSIGGTVRSKRPLDLEEVRVSLLEQGLDVPLQPEGRFAIGHLRAGEYTIEVTVPGQLTQRYAITVPAADYDLEL